MQRGDIEGTYAELDLGRMLYQSDLSFRFVTRSGKKGDDFDIEILFSDGVTVCADAKCKIETTEFSEQTVLNSLRHARGQFPKDKPSIVFVKMPSRWIADNSNMKEMLTKIATVFLRGTGRVVSVKYYASQIQWEDGHVLHVQAFHEISNNCDINRFDPSRNWDMFIESDVRFGPDGIKGFSSVPEKWQRLVHYPDGFQ